MISVVRFFSLRSRIQLIIREDSNLCDGITKVNNEVHHLCTYRESGFIRFIFSYKDINSGEKTADFSIDDESGILISVSQEGGRVKRYVSGKQFSDDS